MRGATTIIALVPEAEAAVGSWRSRLDPWARRGVPAHVTLLAPFLPPPRLDGATVARLGAVLRRHAAVDIALTRVEQLPGAVALLPEPTEPLLALTRALLAEWPELAPRSCTGRERPYHLTVACTDAPALLAEVEADLEHALPIRARLRDVLLLAEQSDGTPGETARFRLASW
jgi:hypothetical protein